MDRNQQFAEFLCTDTEAALGQIALGQEISAEMLKIAFERKPEILEKILSTKFMVRKDLDIYSGELISNAKGIYDFLWKVYGVEEVTRKILANTNMWEDFLPFVELEFAEKKKFLIRLLKEKRYSDAALFASGVQLSDVELDKALVDEFFAHAQNFDEDGVVRICGFPYLMAKGCWYCTSLYCYIIDEEGCIKQSAIEEVIACPGGIEALKNLDDEDVNAFLHVCACN